MSINLKNQRVAVTGSAGVIGRELLRRLQTAGAKVLSLDREPLPAAENWRGVAHLQADLADADLTPLRQFCPRVLFHLAAAFERSAETPEFWSANWHDNTLVSHRLADALREMPQTEIAVFASSYLIYSPSLYLFPRPRRQAAGLEEDAEIATRNLCGGAKLYAEREFEFVREAVRPSLRSVYARIFRVYGRDSRDVISRWVRAALRGEQLHVYNPENRFDYIFAGDVADGLFRLAITPRAQGVVNLGTGQARSVREVLCAVSRHIPSVRPLIVDDGAAPPFEVSCANLNRLHKLLNWKPDTSLEDGIRMIVDYERTTQINGTVA